MKTIDIDSRRELFVDSHLIERMDAAQLRLHSPQPREIALTCDRPWEEKGPGYTTVIQDGETYRMYYRANPGGEGTDNDPTQVTCYAESSDGIHWHKPELGIVEFEGSKRNNILWQGLLAHNFTPFRDDNPACPPEHRYKGIGGTSSKWGGEDLVPVVSADGIHWQRFGEDPLPLKGNFDSQNAVFWDAHAGLYRAYWRAGRRDDSELPRGRDIDTATSHDFIHWSDSEHLVYDPSRSGSPERDQGDDPSGDHHQLYTNNVQTYPRAPHLLLGFPARYCDRGWTASTDALPEREKRRELADLGIGGGRPTRSGTALWDTLFMASRDGTNFHVWPEAFIRPGIQRPGSWFYGQAGMARGIVETPSTFIGGPRELSFYVKDNARTDGPYRLRRYNLRLDGFASLYAPLTGGTVTTKPLTFTGSRLEINFSSSAGGRLRIGLQEPDGTDIPGYTFDECDLQYGDQLDRVVSWNGETNVGALAERPVRLRIELKDADLFSFRFSNE